MLLKISTDKTVPEVVAALRQDTEHASWQDPFMEVAEGVLLNLT